MAKTQLLNRACPRGTPGMKDGREGVLAPYAGNGIHDMAHRLSGRASRPVSGLAGVDVESSGTMPSHAQGTVA